MRTKVILAVCGLVLLSGGFAAGRYVIPPKVVVTEKVKEVEKQVVVTKTEVKVVTVKDTTTVVRYKERTEKKPDGTVITEIEGGTEEHVDESTDTEVKKDDIAVKESSKDVEKTKTVENRPDWLIGVGAGVALTSVTELPVLQLSVDRRIFGPVFGGLVVSNKGFVGIGIKIEF
jgi:hypothetical protein